MSTTTLRSRSQPPAAAGESNRLGRWAAGVAAVAMIGLLLAWLLGWFGAAVDPRVAEIQQLRDDLAAKYRAGGGPANTAEAAALVTSMGEIRQKIDALPEHLRPQAERGGGSAFRSAMRARIDAYFAAPPEQRLAVLDRQIDQEEVMSKAFEAARAVTSALGGGNAGGGGAGATAGGAASGPQGGPPRGGTEEDRNRWRKNLIDRTSPEERARYVEYRRAADERRQQRGLPVWGR